VRTILAAPPDRAAIRRYAERHGWQETTEGLCRLFEGIVGAQDGPHTPGGGQR
jgi:hypothetical protein